jgi:hypothetical protein
MKAALECLTSQPELNYEAVAGVSYFTFQEFKKTLLAILFFKASN